ncbi:hypothetical protein LH89_21650 [Dickeya fangzhongdai]|nr:hypothetical protein LH89_21650 [Dickeya fangzhongdai]
MPTRCYTSIEGKTLGTITAGAFTVAGRVQFNLAPVAQPRFRRVAITYISTCFIGIFPVSKVVGRRCI